MILVSLLFFHLRFRSHNVSRHRPKREVSGEETTGPSTHTTKLLRLNIPVLPLPAVGPRLPSLPVTNPLGGVPWHYHQAPHATLQWRWAGAPRGNRHDEDAPQETRGGWEVSLHTARQPRSGAPPLPSLTIAVTETTSPRHQHKTLTTVSRILTPRYHEDGGVPHDHTDGSQKGYRNVAATTAVDARPAAQ